MLQILDLVIEMLNWEPMSSFEIKDMSCNCAKESASLHKRFAFWMIQCIVFTIFHLEGKYAWTTTTTNNSDENRLIKTQKILEEQNKSTYGQMINKWMEGTSMGNENEPPACWGEIII